MALLKRHDIEPDLVVASVARQCARYEDFKQVGMARAEENLLSWETEPQYWDRKPATAADIEKTYDKFIDTEHTHYSTVRILEMGGEKPGFLLVYGPMPDEQHEHGTGPFETLDKARAWFLNNGR
jgi:hypothetical protein